MGFFIFTFHDVSINTHHTASDRGYIPVFTFHDVSINTFHIPLKTSGYTPLHSTMFLLIHSIRPRKILIASSFTFHDVSINTTFSRKNDVLETTLHSTMFLLIPRFKLF